MLKMGRFSLGLCLLLCLLAAEAIQAARVDRLDSILRKDKKDKKSKDDKGSDKQKPSKGKDNKSSKSSSSSSAPVAIKHACQVIDSSKFTTFFALGDLHGAVDHVALLTNAGIIDAKQQWIAKSTLLVITGDTVHGGPESVGVWDLIQSLIKQAPSHQSQVILLMGNHESDHAANLVKDKDVTEAAKQFGKDVYPKVQAAMSALPVCAVLDKIMFAHSGFIDANWDKDQSKFAKNIQKYWNDLSDVLSKKKYDKLLSEKGPGSIVGRHDWVKDSKLFRHNRKALALMGFDMLIAGHEAKLFGDSIPIGNAVAVNQGLHFVKMDVGMKPGILAPGKGFPGSILKCPISVSKATKTIVSACSTASSTNDTPNAKAQNKVIVTKGGDDGDKNDD